MGRCAMGLRDFWDATLRDVVNVISGHDDAMEALERSRWEAVRWQTTLLMNVQIPKGKRLKPKDLVVFPWESGGGRERLDINDPRVVEALKKMDGKT